MTSREPASASTEGGVSAQMREVDAATARAWYEAHDCVLIDVREDAEFQAERIRGAVLVPLSRLESSVLPVPAGTKTVFLCRSGNRTRVHAARLLRCACTEPYVLQGGLLAWKACGFPVDSG